MIVLIALVIRVLFLGMNNVESEPVVIPPMPNYAPTIQETDEKVEWLKYNYEAFIDYRAEFTAIFNAVEYKRAKNGRSMVKGTHDNSFKFCKKG
jgi:hypothetical protein